MQRSLIVARFVVLAVLAAAPAWSQTAPDPKIIEGAKKEGEVIYFTTMTLDQSKQVVDRFEKKYPFLKVTLFRTGGGPLLNKILTEARGGRFAWDVVVGRGEMVIPLSERKLLASYRSPETKMIDPQLVDKEGLWTAYYVNSYVLGWNTKLVKKEDVPRTYEALLDPKWKGGKISVDTEAYGMLEGLKGAWGAEKAVNFFKRLAAQDPVVKRGNTERVQLAVAGEYALIIAYNQTIQRMTSKGAPIDWLPLEPVVTQVNPVMLGVKAPHPNAARLFYDFILSKEGQEMLVGMQRIPVRKDVEPDPPRLFRGFKYVIENPEDYKDFDATVKQYMEIFKLR
ncbi:MAG TPA: extracellular solute-binding protein [Candidatus Acidoferrales bacterium]|nr:extracellular solute-binding protein [Candidatus Acidoferrales bacterium]